MKISWYSIDLELAVVEHEPVELYEALEIVDRYLAHGSDKCERGEEAISKTMFGFCRSNSEFIEICVNGPAQISYKFEAPQSDSSWFGKLLRGPFQHDEELQSRDELLQKVEEFFTTPIQEIKRRLKNR